MFNVRLKELRENSGLSQEALARKLGVKQSTVGMWESGTNRPRGKNLDAIIELFGVSADYLLGRDGPDDGHNEQVNASPDPDAEFVSLYKTLTSQQKQRVSDFTLGIKSSDDAKSKK